MNDKGWIIPYAILSFSIFIASTLFLFSSDRIMLVPHTVTIISSKPMYRDHFYPTQGIPSDPTSCINDLFNKFRTGNLNPEMLREGIDRCFGLNSNDNNSQVIPQPQPPSGLAPRIL